MGALVGEIGSSTFIESALLLPGRLTDWDWPDRDACLGERHSN